MHNYYELRTADAQTDVVGARSRRGYVALAVVLATVAGVGTLVLMSDTTTPHVQATVAPIQAMQAIPNCQPLEYDVDYTGNDIGSVPSNNALDCCTSCNQRTGCGAFSWSNYQGGTCWLKSGKTGTSNKSGVLSAVLSTPPTPVFATTCSNVETNVDYVGNDIDNVLGSSSSDCCTKCSQRVGCRAFSWSNYQGGTCWLKSGKGTTAAISGVVSAVLGSSSSPSTQTCPTFDTNVDYVANDVANVPGSSASECCAKCSQRGDCKAFTWTNYLGGMCWLKSGKGATIAKPGAVSGVVQTGNASPTPSNAAPPPATTAPTATVTCHDVFTDAEYVGNDMANVPGSGPDDCCTKCAQRGGCGAFTWTNYNGGTCWLKYGRGTMAPKAGAISAYTANTLTTPMPVPIPSNLPLGYIYGGASRPQTDLPSENGVFGNPSSYPNLGCKQLNYVSKTNKIFAVGPNNEWVPMAIKGANWYGMETGMTVPMGMWYNEKNGSTAYSIAAYLQRNNFNSVRLPIRMESLLNNIVPTPGYINTTANRAIKTDSYMNLIKSIVKALGYRQISVLIDIHTLTSTDIGMLWYNNDISEARFLQGIDMLTQNLCSSEFYNVIGIDLKNEPASATWGDNSATTDFRAAAQRIGNRMLAGCPNWLAFVEGISENEAFYTSSGQRQYFGDWWGGGFERAKQNPVVLSIPDKVVYSPHFYTSAVWPSEGLFGPNFAELSDDQLRENVRLMFDTMFGYLAQDPNWPAIVLGEFGGMFMLDKHPWKTIQRCIRYTVEMLIRPGFAGGYVWSLNPESGYDWNPKNIASQTQEGLLLSDWRYTNEPMLWAFTPMDSMPDLKPLRCFT